ncbi:MAG: peroxiredoxin [Gammaproteobacteria bacterium]|nr:peroxiredoxin [Gammaproteobacteria bacterium]
MPKVKLNLKIPKFKFIATSTEAKSLEDFSGKNIVLYFYPKDNTSGCTQESEDFRDAYKKFKNLNTEIIGISKDSMKSHQNFSEKYSLPFPLISDPEKTICELFEVMKEKSMYGRKYLGIERSTFLIDSNGKLLHEWRKVKVPGHVTEVLIKTKELTTATIK